MPLERKPVEEIQEPGYPSIAEFITGRRSFVGLLGLTALSVGSATLFSGCRTGPRGAVNPVQPATPPSGEGKAPPPPQPPTQQETRLKGDVAPVTPTTIESGDQPKPQPPASSEAKPPGAVRPVEPARPKARTIGEE